MKYINFDESRELDLILLGRVAIDFNPAYSEEVKEEFKPLKVCGRLPGEYCGRRDTSWNESGIYRKSIRRSVWGICC